jgi:hypothetical protein
MTNMIRKKNNNNNNNKSKGTNKSNRRQQRVIGGGGELLTGFSSPSKQRGNWNNKTRQQQQQQSTSGQPLDPLQSYSSPFCQYLTQIENDYGVTSIESVGPNAAVPPGVNDENQHPLSSRPYSHMNYDYGSNASVSDVYAIAVMQNPEGYEDDVSTLGDESMIRRAARSLWGSGSLPPPEEIAPSQPPVTQPNDLKDIKIDKSKSRTGNTFIQNYFSFSNSNDEEKRGNNNGHDEEDENVKASTPRSEDVYTTIDVPVSSPDDTLNSKIVDGDDDDDDSETLKDDKQTKQPSFAQKNKWLIIKFMVGLSIFLLVLATVALTFSLMHVNDRSSSSGYEESNESFNDLFFDDSMFSPPIKFPPKNDPVPTPTTSISPPTNAPSFIIQIITNETTTDNNSTTTSIEDIKVDLLSVISNYTATSLTDLVDTQTPQYQAYDWILRDPNYWTYSERTILQRWVLAVLYFRYV